MFEIYSASEDAWWNEDLGWVSDRRYADMFDDMQRSARFLLPLSAGNDAKWIPVRVREAA
jgi:hypothetical protein